MGKLCEPLSTIYQHKVDEIRDGRATLSYVLLLHTPQDICSTVHHRHLQGFLFLLYVRTGMELTTSSGAGNDPSEETGDREDNAIDW